MNRITLVACLLTLAAVPFATAQLPPDAVMLDKVKIPEAQKSHELDPVTLEAADPNLPTFEHGGVTYGQSAAGSKDEFMSDPDTYAAAHDRQRWENNFTKAMSTIWCPVTDEISPGGNLIWEKLGYEWESCCQFCNDTKTDEDFPRALKRLKKRAGDSYDLIGGAKYTEGASSPVEGAINLGGPIASTPEPEAAASAPVEPAWLQGQELAATWSGGIGLMTENRCSECHRPGGAAPMPLQTVGQIRKWQKNLKTHIENGTMPPWPADTAHAYANGKNLTPREKETFLAWIDAGYPPGDGAYTASGAGGEWSIGEPDHVFELEAYTLPEDSADHAREFEIATNFDEDKWIVASEIQPTDSFLVLEMSAGPLGSYHRGNNARIFADGHGALLKKGESVTVRVFYTKEAGWEEFDDSSRIAVKFGDGAGRKPVHVDRAANDEFTIAAGDDSAEVSSTFTFPGDGTLVSVNPVVRMRGKQVTATVKTPDGTEQTILSIPYWDINWHFRYDLAEPIEAPKGTVVTITAKYDNSDMNAANPDPSQEVKGGTTELLEGWVSYTLDEVRSAANRFGLNDEALAKASGNCEKCNGETCDAEGAVATD